MAKTILVVDDSTVSRHIITSFFEPKGYSVVAARDGCEALNWTCQHLPADLVVTDMHMPQLSGVDLIRALRAKLSYRHTPILVLTSGADDAEKQSAKQAGATGWVVKPFNEKSLLDAVEKLTGQG